MNLRYVLGVSCLGFTYPNYLQFDGLHLPVKSALLLKRRYLGSQVELLP